MTDWAKKLEGLHAGELAATNEIIALITRYLACKGAFQLRDSWDDLVQEALIALIRHPPKSREPGAIVRHIQTTCYRLYIDEIRRTRGRRRQKHKDDQDGAGWRRDVSLDELSEPDMSEDFWSKQMDLGVRDALDRLEERKRQALEAVYLAGFTYEEATVQLDTPLGTLKGLLREGLAELRKLILAEDEKSSSDSQGSSVSSEGALAPGSAEGDG